VTLRRAENGRRRVEKTGEKRWTSCSRNKITTAGCGNKSGPRARTHLTFKGTVREMPNLDRGIRPLETNKFMKIVKRIDIATGMRILPRKRNREETSGVRRKGDFAP